MVLELEYGKWILVCDYCEETHELDTFFDAMGFMEAEGWKKYKPKDEWVHECSYCNKFNTAKG